MHRSAHTSYSLSLLAFLSNFSASSHNTAVKLSFHFSFLSLDGETGPNFELSQMGRCLVVAEVPHGWLLSARVVRPASPNCATPAIPTAAVPYLHLSTTCISTTHHTHSAHHTLLVTTGGVGRCARWGLIDGSVWRQRSQLGTYSTLWLLSAETWCHPFYIDH